MSFDYNAMTEDEVQKARFQLLDGGEYDAIVDAATHEVSSKGNQMIKLSLSVFDPNGVIVPVFDYLVFTNQMMWKVKHFCDSAGLEKEYMDKKFDALLADRQNVRVKLIVQEGSFIPEAKLNGKPQGSRYPTKNAVEDYLIRTPGTQARNLSKLPEKDDFDDKDIPF